MRYLVLIFFLGPILIAIGLSLPWVEYNGVAGPEGPDWTEIHKTEEFWFNEVVPGFLFGVILQFLLIIYLFVKRRIIKHLYWFVLILLTGMIIFVFVLGYFTAGFGPRYIRLSTGVPITTIGIVFSYIAGFYILRRGSQAADKESI